MQLLVSGFYHAILAQLSRYLDTPLNVLFFGTRRVAFFHRGFLKSLKIISDIID